jgi:hypothetical protein
MRYFTSWARLEGDVWYLFGICLVVILSAMWAAVTAGERAHPAIKNRRARIDGE